MCEHVYKPATSYVSNDEIAEMTERNEHRFAHLRRLLTWMCNHVVGNVRVPSESSIGY